MAETERDLTHMNVCFYMSFRGQ